MKPRAAGQFLMRDVGEAQELRSQPGRALLSRLGCATPESGSLAEKCVKLLDALIPHRLLPLALTLAVRGDLGQLGSGVAALAAGRKSGEMNAKWLHRESGTVAALLAEGIDLLVLKGALLAYSVYPTPNARFRTDTDILVPVGQVESAVSVLRRLGYVTPYEVTGVVNPTQHMWVLRGEQPAHVVDLHWSLSQHPAFDGLLPYDTLRANAAPVPGLCNGAMGLCAEDALLHACIHYFGHHRGEFRPLQWVLDVDLLWRSMDDDARDKVLQRAGSLQISGLVFAMLQESSELFSTPVATEQLATLHAAGKTQWRTAAAVETSSSLKNFLFSLRSEKTLKGRASRVWRTLVPPAAYMRARNPKSTKSALVWSYVTRIFRGVYRAIR